ncbi:hypothetical protein JKF63_00840 [Porcisia hertigi]|uniref:SWIM-type domain-containing protein n=1 Tax=Porcisia hertigi TaxID=2761500 RepID=A0A836L7C1_9TRYP|nr:hypothetical protein JKF63_00840 [Porcisia hertigi]
MDTAAGRLSRAVENYLAPITRAVLDNYATYIAVNSGTRDTQHLESTDGSGVQQVPRSIEEALAPLEILYGKTALSAIGIALHGAEPIIRYVERAEVKASDNATKTSTDDEVNTHHETQHGESSVMDVVSSTGLCNAALEPKDHGSTAGPSFQVAKQRERHLYQVGEHTLFSPYYCPCSAYVYQSIQRQNVWCCKHLLALQLALRVEAFGVAQDNLRERIVSPTEYEQLLLRTL